MEDFAVSPVTRNHRAAVGDVILHQAGGTSARLLGSGDHFLGLNLFLLVRP